MRRICELISIVAETYPADDFFVDFERSCRVEPVKKRYYRTYEEALRFLDEESWMVLKAKAVKHYLDHRAGQTKQGFFNQLNEAFAYRHLMQCKFSGVRMIPEQQRRTPDLKYFESGQLKHCEVKTIGISDTEIERRQSGRMCDAGVYQRPAEGFFKKLQSAVKTARQQIRAQRTEGMVYLVVLLDDITLDYYDEYRRQILSHCRELGFQDLYMKVGLRGSRRIRITSS